MPSDLTLIMPRVIVWPTRDLDAHGAIIEARTALHRRDEPTLPILEAVLAGLRRLL